MKTTYTSKEINWIWSNHVTKEYCASMEDKINFTNSTNTNKEAVLFMLPKAVHYFVHYYYLHKESPETESAIFDTFHLDKIIPLDTSKWNDPEIIEDVYNAVLSSTLGNKIYFVICQMLNSDYWKAYMYIQKNVEDDITKKILMKAINGKKPYDIIISMKAYNETFNS